MYEIGTLTRVDLPAQLLDLVEGAKVNKRNLYQLIQYSKVPSAPQWGGLNWIIGNTPQQGINWIGPFTDVKAVIIKVRHGRYREDGWVSQDKRTFRYSFKAKKGDVNRSEKANAVLINQPKKYYPILLFSEIDDCWNFCGAFRVTNIGENAVYLAKAM